MNNEKSAIHENLFNNHFFKKITLTTSEFIKLKIAFTVLKF